MEVFLDGQTGPCAAPRVELGFNYALETVQILSQNMAENSVKGDAQKVGHAG